MRKEPIEIIIAKDDFLTLMEFVQRKLPIPTPSNITEDLDEKPRDTVWVLLYDLLQHLFIAYYNDVSEGFKIRKTDLFKHIRTVRLLFKLIKRLWRILPLSKEILKTDSML